MSKRKAIILTICLATAFTCAGMFSACDEKGSSPSDGSSATTQTPIVTEYKVKFDTLGGPYIKAQFVKKGEKAVKPAENPTRAGYVFAGWELNSNPYDFNAPVTRDITLKAKWALEEPTKFDALFISENETFTTDKVIDGRKLMEPAENPSREGYFFDYWKGENGERYDFETPVTENITLYAEWIKAWEVSFDVGDGTAVETLSVREGESISAPQTKQSGYYVSDWLIGTESYDFETPITQNITLSAVWSPYGLESNQIGCRVYGSDVSSDKEYFALQTGSKGEIVVTANFKGDTNYHPALILKNIYAKSYYEKMIANGDARLTFDLKVDGDSASQVSDLYVFGKALTLFPKVDGVYKISIDFSSIVYYYDTILPIATNTGAAGTASSFNAKFIAWKSTVWHELRNYEFTISDIVLKPTPTINLNFASGDSDVLAKGASVTLVAQTNADDPIVWSTSDASVATVENGVVKGVKGGMVTITATIGSTTASKIICVKGDGLTSNQIGMVNAGWAYESKAGYFNMETGANGEMVVTTKIQAVKANPSALVLRNLYDKAYYEKLIASGYTKLSFQLQVGGADATKVSDLYVFGTALSTFTQSNGAYAVTVNLSTIVENYATIAKLGQATQATVSEFNQMLIGWKDTTNNWSARNYVFTISNASFEK